MLIRNEGAPARSAANLWMLNPDGPNWESAGGPEASSYQGTVLRQVLSPVSAGGGALQSSSYYRGEKRHADVSKNHADPDARRTDSRGRRRVTHSRGRGCGASQEAGHRPGDRQFPF